MIFRLDPRARATLAHLRGRLRRAGLDLDDATLAGLIVRAARRVGRVPVGRSLVEPLGRGRRRGKFWSR